MVAVGGKEKKSKSEILFLALFAFGSIALNLAVIVVFYLLQGVVKVA